MVRMTALPDKPIRAIVWLDWGGEGWLSCWPPHIIASGQDTWEKRGKNKRMDKYAATETFPAPSYYALEHKTRKHHPTQGQSKTNPDGRWYPADMRAGIPLILTSLDEGTCSWSTTAWWFRETIQHGQLHYYAAVPDRLWKALYNIAELDERSQG